MSGSTMRPIGLYTPTKSRHTIVSSLQAQIYLSWRIPSEVGMGEKALWLRHDFQEATGQATKSHFYRRQFIGRLNSKGKHKDGTKRKERVHLVLFSRIVVGDVKRLSQVLLHLNMALFTALELSSLLESWPKAQNSPSYQADQGDYGGGVARSPHPERCPRGTSRSEL